MYPFFSFPLHSVSHLLCSFGPTHLEEKRKEYKLFAQDLACHKLLGLIRRRLL